jgi:CRISPR-associated protein Csb2
MLSITVEFLNGTYRADPDGTAITGNDVDGEWPPTPMRLFSALVAADGTRDRCRVTTGDELRFLEGASAPTIYADPAAETRVNRRLPRFVVKAETSAATGKSHQEYQGRAGAAVRPGASVAPRHPVVSFVWPETPTAAQRRGIELRAARVGYLGCADSPVRVIVGDAPHPDAPTHRYEPDPSGEHLLGVVQPGILDALDAHFDRWVEGGPSVTRRQSPGLRRLAAYAADDERAETVQPERPTMLVYRFDRPVSGRRVSVVTDALKGTVLTRYQQRIGSEPPGVLHGHLPAGDESPRVSFLALPNTGAAHSDGMIHGVALLFPIGSDPALISACRTALAGDTELHGTGFRRSIQPHTGQPFVASLAPKRWAATANRWATVFPAVHERRGVTIDVDEIERWCERVGLPRPAGVRVTRKPFVRGGVDLAPREVNRSGKDPKPYSHIEMVFEDDVTGPVVIGSGRFRGLGLCAPVRDQADSGRALDNVVTDRSGAGAEGAAS